jgi:hypothetical protein
MRHVTVDSLGIAEGLLIDGIPLRDRVWLDLYVDQVR